MRVLITRPKAQAEDFAAALQQMGAQAIFFPTIEIKPVDDFACLDSALAQLDCYDWLLLTSGNAVDVVLKRMTSIGIATIPGNLRVAAIGSKTASKLKDAGLHPDFVPAKYIAEAILPGLGNLQDCWVLLPTADIAHDTLPKAIQDRNGIAHVITAYHTVLAGTDFEGLAVLHTGVDIITFTSGSTVENFVTMVQNAGLDPFNLPGNPQIACIGPKTAKEAQEAGFLVSIIASPHTIEGLIHAIQNEVISNYP